MDVRNGGPASAGPVFDVAALVTRIISGAVLAGLVVLVCLEAFLRGAFSYSLGFAEELTGYCVVLLTFFGAALALRANALFQVHFLFDRYRPEIRTWVQRIFAILALIICVILAWKCKDLMMSSFSRGRFAATVLRTPLWIPQMILPVGFTVIAIFLLEQVLLTFRRNTNGGAV